MGVTAASNMTRICTACSAPNQSIRVAPVRTLFDGTGGIGVAHPSATLAHMMARLLDLMGLVALLGWVAIAWVLLGRAARAAGMGRLQLLGLAALLAWLMGH